jgi:hypothetical protein
MSNTPNLDAEEAFCAAKAVAPRVTLESIKARIKHCFTFTAGAAVEALVSTTIRSEMEVSKDGAPLSMIRLREMADLAMPQLDLLTIYVGILDNGWSVIGKSAPASPENYDEQKGRQLAEEDAIRQLWPLEGYLLREALSKADPS